MELDKFKLSRPEQAVVLCGGLGVRMRPYTNTLPKPMVLCNGKPFLWYILQQLQDKGIRRFVLLTGYRSEQIEQFFKDGSEWDLVIQYSKGPVEWDTGKRIWEAKEELDDRFLLLYSDNFVPFPMDKVLAHHQKMGSSLTFMVSPKSPGNINIDRTGTVERYDNNRSNDLDYVEIGYMIVEKEKTMKFFETPECSFSDVLCEMAKKQKISAWIQHDKYHSISDPERWKIAEAYLRPKKIVLLDRDGVINEKAPNGKYINRWEDFRWIERTRKSLRKLSSQGFQFIVITNQAGIARGITHVNEIEQIHNEMIEELARDGVQIIEVYVCPHHWDDGCFCRKPKPGLLFQAAKDHLLRLDRTCYVGDDQRDMDASEEAGCEGIYWRDEPNYPEWAGVVLRKLTSNL